MAQQPQHGDGNLNLLYKIASNTYDISQNGGSPSGLGTMSTQDADSVDITGGAISGVTINAESLEVGNAVTADLYVGPDGNVGIGTDTTTEKLTIDGNIDISNWQIKNLGVPLDDADAATKLYVDTAVVGSVGATGPLPWNFIGVYDNGVSYNLNDAVTYAGGYYYRTGNPLNPGYPPTPGSINASWTPVADGGATGLQGDVGATGLEGATGLQGATGLTGAGGASGFWGSFWSNQDQSAANTTTAYPITLNNTDPDSIGVSVVSNSRITFANAGVYNIQFSAQADRVSGSGSDSIDIWFRKNGTDIPESNGVITVAGGAAAAKTIASWNYMLKLSAGDYVELAWRTSDTNLQFIHEASATSPTRPAIPSVIVTAQQVMNTQLGATGATGPTATPTDIQVFSTPGAFTWTKPLNAKSVNVTVISGGCGGGSGAMSLAGSPASGGGGGGGGARTIVTLQASLLAASENGVVGAGGAGGASVTSIGFGNDGTNGAASYFGLWAFANGGIRGGGGTATGGTSGSGGGRAAYSGGSGSSGAATGSASSPLTNVTAGTGGAGGAGTNGSIAATGGSGALSFSYNGSSNFVIAAGVNGPSVPTNTPLNGSGGGGGSSSITAPAMAGGNGGLYGAGGGGGGGGSGFASGKGGDGSQGIVVVTTYF